MGYASVWSSASLYWQTICPRYSHALILQTKLTIFLGVCKLTSWPFSSILEYLFSNIEKRKKKKDENFLPTEDGKAFKSRLLTQVCLLQLKSVPAILCHVYQCFLLGHHCQKSSTFLPITTRHSPSLSLLDDSNLFLKGLPHPSLKSWNKPDVLANTFKFNKFLWFYQVCLWPL